MRTTAKSVNRLTRHRKTPSGYADVQSDYMAAGWIPLPLPRGQKYPPPRGYTGERAGIPDYKKYSSWAGALPDGNIALPMPPDVIGIDVDAYHGGLGTLVRLEGQYGELPPSYYSTSRTDGSGIHFYGVTAGTKLVGKISGGIEVIQSHHRYAVVWPSLHPEGRIYQWHAADGSPPGIPSVDNLPELPEQWVSGLAAKPKARGGGGYDGDAGEWFDGLPAGILPMGYKIQVRKSIRALEREGGRYDTMITMVARLVGWGAAGLPVGGAINDLFTAYVAAVDGERSRHPESEFDRALEGAISKFGAK